MPDISMCMGGECPKKSTCYRFKAKPCEYRQSYFSVPPYKDDKCTYYWPTEEEIEKTRKKKLKSD